jgi:hypothetical protein
VAYPARPFARGTCSKHRAAAPASSATSERAPVTTPYLHRSSSNRLGIARAIGESRIAVRRGRKATDRCPEEARKATWVQSLHRRCRRALSASAACPTKLPHRGPGGVGPAGGGWGDLGGGVHVEVELRPASRAIARAARMGVSALGANRHAWDSSRSKKSRKGIALRSEDAYISSSQLSGGSFDDPHDRYI